MHILRRSIAPSERVLALIAACTLAAGCSYDVQPQRRAKITFADRPPLAFNVARIEVVSGYAPPLAPPNMEHRLANSPETVLRRWAADRLRAGGRSGTARFTITDASVTNTALPVIGGVAGLFRNDQAERYQAVAAARLEIYDAFGNRLAVAEARAERMQTVAEGATLDERERMMFQLTEALISDFDREMEKAVRLYLAAWLL